MEKLVAGQDITKEDLVLLGQLPDPIHDRGQFYSQLRSGLLSMKSDPVITLLILPESQQQEASPEQLFKRAETENSAEVCFSIGGRARVGCVEGTGDMCSHKVCQFLRKILSVFMIFKSGE